MGVSAAASHGPHGAAARVIMAATLAKNGGGAAGSVNGGGEGSDLMDQQAQFGYERSAPAQSVSGAAMVAALQQAAALPTSGGAWQEVTTQPYNAQPSTYTDPF
jgi:hypothetical protein